MPQTGDILQQCPNLLLITEETGAQRGWELLGVTSLLGLPAEPILHPQGPSPGSILQIPPRDPGQEWRERCLGW